MRKAYAIVLAGLGAASIAGAAVAASRDTHTMNVPLPDGSTARVEYVGNVAPKVTVVPAPVSPFGLFDRSMFDMHRQIDAMMREVDAMTRMPVAGAPNLNVAAYGNAPEGTQSITVVSTSNGAKTCTGNTAEPRRYFLHRPHKGRGQYDSPAQSIAVLRSDLRIGGYAARVVIRSAGDDTGTELAHEIA